MEGACQFSYSSADLSESEKLLELAAYVQGQKALLLAGLSHLRSYHELLADELDSNSRAEDFLSKCDGISRRLQRLADSIDVTSVDGCTDEDIDVSVLLQGVLGQCQALAASCGVSCRLEAAPSMRIRGAICQLQQLFYSVVVTLFDALSSEGGLLVTANAEDCGQQALRRFGSECPAGRYVFVDFHKDGAAVPEQFDRVDGIFLSDKEPGIPIQELTGWLGKVCGWGGEVLVGGGEPAPWVRILLPACVDGVQEAPSSELTGGTETILVVDDEDMIWDVVMDMLSGLGYTVLLVANGKEAVETYRNNPGEIDLVIMDMVMPEMNGREAFDHLKRLDPTVKVLFSSGYVADSDAQYVMGAGAAGFLRKPYRLAELARLVRQLLDK